MAVSVAVVVAFAAAVAAVVAFDAVAAVVAFDAVAVVSVAFSVLLLTKAIVADVERAVFHLALLPRFPVI